MKRVLLSVVLIAFGLTKTTASSLPPWPLWSIRTTVISENVIAKQRAYKYLGSKFTCIHEMSRARKYWGWKSNASKFKLYNSKGKLLSPRSYDRLLITPEGLLIGMNFIKNPSSPNESKCVAEHINETSIPSPTGISCKSKLPSGTQVFNRLNIRSCELTATGTVIVETIH